MNKKSTNLLLSAILSSALFGCNSGGTANQPSNTPDMSKSNANLTTNIAVAKNTNSTNSTNPSTICYYIRSWDNQKEYTTPGQVVSYLGKEYRNNWWTKGDNPAQHNGVYPGSGQPWTEIGQCADNTATPAIVQGGTRNTFVLTQEGDIYASGKGYYGVLGNGSTADSNTPVKVQMPVKAVKVVSNDTGNVACAIGTDAQVYCWGGNGTGLQGTGDTNGSVLTPRLTKFPSGAKDMVITSDLTSLVLTNNGQIYASGKGNYGILGNGSTANVTTPVQVLLPDSEYAIKIVKSSLNDEGDDACALTKNGNVYCWGGNAHGMFGVGDTKEYDTPVQVKLNKPVSDIVLGGYSDLFMITKDGDIYASGSDAWGALGDGKDTTDSYLPVKVNMPAGIKTTKVVSSGYDSCALGSDNQMYCWGGDASSMFGIGNHDKQLSPVLTGFPSHIFDIVMGKNRVMFALTRDGSLYASGYGDYGVLGNGNNNDTNTPTQTSLQTPAISIVSNGVTSCSLDQNLNVYCWGGNANGVMGNGQNAGSVMSPTKTQFAVYSM